LKATNYTLTKTSPYPMDFFNSHKIKRLKSMDEILPQNLKERKSKHKENQRRRNDDMAAFDWTNTDQNSQWRIFTCMLFSLIVSKLGFHPFPDNCLLKNSGLPSTISLK